MPRVELTLLVRSAAQELSELTVGHNSPASLMKDDADSWPKARFLAQSSARDFPTAKRLDDSVESDALRHRC